MTVDKASDIGWAEEPGPYPTLGLSGHLITVSTVTGILPDHVVFLAKSIAKHKTKKKP